MAGHPTWPGTLPAVARVSWVGHVATTQIVNVMHFGLAGITDIAGATAWLAALLPSLNTNVRVAYLACKPNDYTLDVIRGQIVQIPGLSHVALAPLDQVPSTTAGAVAAAATSLTDCVVLKMRTALGGKHHRGRIYVGPIWAAAVPLGGVLTDTTTRGYFNGLITALNGYIGSGAHIADGILGVYSRPLHAGEQQWTVRVGHTLTVKSNTLAYTGDMQEVTTMLYDWTLRELHRRELGVGS